MRATNFLAGRVALVTGAGRGLGRAHALALAAHGAAVVVNDLGTDLAGRGSDSGPAHEVAREISELGGRAVADVTDVASVSGGEAAVEAALTAFGGIDVVVNNAGVAGGGGSVSDLEEADYDAQLAVHLRAAIGTTRAAFRQMKPRGWGRILNTVSEVALDSRFGGGGAYGVAKAALWSFTLAAAAEFGPHGTTVNGISPGAATRMSQGVLEEEGGGAFRAGASRGLDLDPRHVARVVAYLCSDEANDINGRVLHVAAGQVREYSITRTSKSDLAKRLGALFE